MRVHALPESVHARTKCVVMPIRPAPPVASELSRLSDAPQNRAKSAYLFMFFAVRLQISAKLRMTMVWPAALRMVYQAHRVRRTAERPNEVQPL